MLNIQKGSREKKREQKQNKQIREGAKYTKKKLIKVIVQSSIHRPYYLIEIEFHHEQRYSENKIHRVETRCDRQKARLVDPHLCFSSL